MAWKLKQFFGNAPIKLIAVILFAIFVPSVLVTALGLVAVFQAQGFVRERFTGPVREKVAVLHSRLQSEWARRLDLYEHVLRDATRRLELLGELRDRDPCVNDLLFAGPSGPSLVADSPPLRLGSPVFEARLKELSRLELLAKDYPAALVESKRLLESNEDDDAVLAEALLAQARIAYKLGDRDLSLYSLRAALARYGNTVDATGIVRAIPILLRIAEVERELGHEVRQREAARDLGIWLKRAGSRMDPDSLAFFRERAGPLGEGEQSIPDAFRGRRFGPQHVPLLAVCLPKAQVLLAPENRIETHVRVGDLGDCDFVSIRCGEGDGIVHLALNRSQFLEEVTRLCAEVELPVEGLSVGRAGGGGEAQEISSITLPAPFTNLEMRYTSFAGLLPEGFRGFGVLTLATFTWAVIVLVLTIVLGVLFTVRSVLREMRTARLKSDFVSFITHELKTPLTAIRTLTETMLAGRIDSPEENQFCIQMISTESERLSKLVEQVLEYSKIERQEKQFRFTSCNMEDVVREAVRLFSDHNRASPREIEINSVQHISKIKMDRASMIELLLNLLSNAAKYSLREKKIVINLRESIDDICVDVVDRGIGIRKRDQKKIFDKFFRADDYLTREIEGTGLGLAFARYIAKVHNGEIRVTSQVSSGSTFTLQLRKTHVLAE